MNDVVVLRRIEPEDGPVLERVRLAALADSPFAFSSTFELESARDQEAWAQRAEAGSNGADRVTFFADHQDDVVGLVGGYRPDPNSGHVELVSMWVAPSARRQGIGRMLVEAIVAWASKTGANEVRLGVAPGNSPAEELYRASGFVHIDEVRPLESAPFQTEVRLALRIG